MRDRRTWVGLVTAVAAAVLVFLQWTGDAPDQGASDPSPTTQSSASSSPDDSSATSSGLPAVAESDLPAEARDTLDRIDQGGPFPYDQDGTVFGNFEGLLPGEQSGYYHEYTVETPGSADRGARRIVTGSDGEYYWTDDHYESFAQIER